MAAGPWPRGTSFSVAQALSWAQGDGSLKNSYQCQRLSAVRGLARYCHAIGLNVQVPPANVLPTTRDRRRPHIYTQGEVDALIDACPHAFTIRWCRPRWPPSSPYWP